MRHFSAVFPRKSSPRPWRCFCPHLSPKSRSRVFSTSVEVFPPSGAHSTASCRLLHVRGGVSAADRNLDRLPQSSPRPWRCFQLWADFVTHRKVFSTSVEVFLTRAAAGITLHRLLHVRGGVSFDLSTWYPAIRSSPRPWRCFFVCLCCCC